MEEKNLSTNLRCDVIRGATEGLELGKNETTVISNEFENKLFRIRNENRGRNKVGNSEKKKTS